MDFLCNLFKENENMIFTIVLIYLLLNGFAFAILSKNFWAPRRNLSRFLRIQLFLIIAAFVTFIMINQMFFVTILSIALLAIYYISLGIEYTIYKYKK